MTDDNQIKELLQYNLSDEQIILKLQSNECTPDEITNTINTMKKIICNEKTANKKQYAQQYYTDHKVEMNKKNKIWNKSHKDVVRKCTRRHTAKKYGLTLEQYDEIYNKQEGKCTICGRHQSELKKALAVDHNHTTCNVRGLICVRCNRAIGMFEDDISLLQNAINYLKK